jgi:hypothetical protein
VRLVAPTICPHCGQVTNTIDGECESCGGDKRRWLNPEWMPSTWVVATALALGAAAIVIASAYGEPARPAAYVGGIVAAAVIAWGIARERD